MHGLIVALVLLAFTPMRVLGAGEASQDCCETGSPFVLGEGFAELPATCETAGYWAARAPDLEARVTMTVDGPLTGVHTDGILAYLVMCEPDDVQVLCVTYSTEGRSVGEVVQLAGGYTGVDNGMVILDPCLASPSQDPPT